MGIGAALSGEQLGRTWFDALARFATQVEDLEAEINLSRQVAAAKAKVGW